MLNRSGSSCPWCDATLSLAGSRATPGRMGACKCRVSTARTAPVPARDTPYPAGPPHLRSNGSGADVPDKAVPYVEHVLDLVLEHIPSYPQMLLVLLPKQDRLLQQVQVLEPQRRPDHAPRPKLIPHYLSSSLSHLSSLLDRVLDPKYVRTPNIP